MSRFDRKTSQNKQLTARVFTQLSALVRESGMLIKKKKYIHTNEGHEGKQW